MPGEMDCAGNQEIKSGSVVAATSSVFSPVDNIWADSSFPHSSLVDNSICLNTTTSHQNLMELSNSEVHALPTSLLVMEEYDNPKMLSLPSSPHGMTEFSDLEVHALPPSSAGLDCTAVTHAMKPFAMQFGCMPPLGNPVAHSNLHAVHAKMHVPSSVSNLSTVEGSSLSGNALCKSYSDVSFPSGYSAARAMWYPNPCVPQASPSRLEFMQSFVNTLVPELKSIHSQSPPISIKEKRSAVRLAADMSLAISAGGNSPWSQALFQELASSSSSKLGMRKHNARKSNSLRGRIYASILRRSSLRVGSQATRLHTRSYTCHSKGSACFSMLRDCSPSTLDLSAKCFHASNDLSASLPGGSFHAVCRKTSSYACRMRRIRIKRRSGLFSYVKILRQSRPTKKFASVQLPVDPCNEASKAYTPSISKEHIMSLGRLVPGGRNMDVPLLFQEAADYILSLQMQVEALQSLSHFVSL